MRPDGSWAHRLPLAESSTPRFSPDGRRLAVTTTDSAGKDSRGRFTDFTGIAVGYANGSGFRYVERHDEYFYSAPDWSPSSNELVFEKYRRESWLIRVSVATGQRRRLGFGQDPKWSRDGRWIAFTYNGRVMIARPNGRGRNTLVDCAGSCSVERWSYDGRSVLFADSRSIDGDEGISRFAVTVATHKVIEFPWPDFDLISPDWRLRAVTHNDGVYVALRDGTHRRRVLGPPEQWGAGYYELGDWQHVP